MNIFLFSFFLFLASFVIIGTYGRDFKRSSITTKGNGSVYCIYDAELRRVKRKKWMLLLLVLRKHTMIYWMVLLLLGIPSWEGMMGALAWVVPKPTTQNWNRMLPSESFEQFNYEEEGRSNGDGLEYILRHSPEFRSRLVALPTTTLLDTAPPLAEIYIQGQCVWARIVAVVANSHKSTAEPKLQVQPLSDNDQETSKVTNMVIDIGQVITIWEEEEDVSNGMLEHNYVVASVDDAAMESVLDQLHRSRFHRFKISSAQRSKREWPDGVEQECSTEPEREHAHLVWRKLQKVGAGYARLVDSRALAQALFPKAEGNLRLRWQAARILAMDADRGGRFKRWPCLYVPSNHGTQITIINGGWLITDPSIRTGTEARKFAERANATRSARNTRTLADARIVQRLECLAMGELMNAGNTERDDGHRPKLELDVREVLQSLQLPLSPDGAKQALVRTGYWSADASKQATLGRVIQPWSPTVLDAARAYATAMENKPLSTSHDRVDLTQLPCVSVDASRATFRDDALGVRLRASTGRFLRPEASKWEILLHVADVSDIYTQHLVSEDALLPPNVSSILREAAARRGSSRYDLPLGPLHLLPPVALQALAFPKTGGVGRSVTIWAYVDERNGAVLDCGMERTLISSPIPFSFAEATNLLEGNRGNDPATNRIQALLMVAERHLQVWQDQRLRKDVAARQRESRLSKRETSSKPIIRKGGRDDGVDGFRRSRGHRLVDAALQLYSHLAIRLLREQTAPYPRAIGADASRGGRVGTAPLRRYIDGQTQRQMLAVLCQYGEPMDMAECQQVSKMAVDAGNSIKNIRSVRSKIARPSS
jgi:RNB domain